MMESTGKQQGESERAMRNGHRLLVDRSKFLNSTELISRFFSDSNKNSIWSIDRSAK